MADNQTTQRQLPTDTPLRNGDYRIIRMIGQGGFGITYLAQHRVFGPVALKELFLNSGATYCSRESTTRQQVIPQFDHTQFELFKKRFEEEARTLFNLQDIEGVVKVLDIFEENDTIYFSMVYLGGEKLEDYIKRRGRLTEEDGLGILKTLGRTLHAIHQRNVLHRDVKPANVIIGTAGQVTLIDFGIARSYVDEITETHTTFHSPRYAPPEQKIANAKLGAYSDVYALGATAYFIFTGTPPQSIEERITEDFISPRQLVASLPAYIDEAITRSLAMKKEARFQTIKDFLAALQITSEPTQSAAPSKSSSHTDTTQITDVEATLIHPEEKPQRAYPEHTVVEHLSKPASDDSTQITETRNTKAPPTPGEDTLIYTPKKQPVRISKWAWAIPLVLALGVAAFFLRNRFKPVDNPVPVVDKPIDTTSQQTTILPTEVKPLIEIPSEDDTQKLDKRKAEIEKKLLGNWTSPSGTANLKLETTHMGKIESTPIAWTIQPMKGGIYLKLESTSVDSIKWRFIISEVETSPKGSIVLKLHDGPETPFTTAENMAVYTRKK